MRVAHAGPRAAAADDRRVSRKFTHHLDAISADRRADAAGNFVVAWISYEDGGDLSEIVARRYDSAGAPIGTEFLVNTYTPGAASDPDVAVGDDGRFVVAWQGPSPGQVLDDVWARAFTSDGIADGADVQLNQSL